MASLTLKSVAKYYGTIAAVRDMNIDIADGELLAVVGPSGCGKTTMLRMIAGLEKVDAGDIHMDGKRINELPSRDRDVAMVFQRYSLYSHLSVCENLGFALKARHLPPPEIKRKVAEIANLLHINHLLSRQPHQLSGGEQQRVAIGRALVRNPRVYLLDEPLSSIDAKLRIEMRTEIKQLHHQLGTTTVYVTHDQAEAMSLGERMVVMKGGAVIQVGRPLDIYNHPKHSFVASFLGNPAMNLIPGHIIRQGSQTLFENESFSVSLPPPLANALGYATFSTDDEYLLGIRPEHIRIGPGPAGEVKAVEMLGAETLLHFKLGAHELCLRLISTSVPLVGSHITCEFSREHLHLFHRAEGISIDGQRNINWRRKI